MICSVQLIVYNEMVHGCAGSLDPGAVGINSRGHCNDGSTAKKIRIVQW